MGYAITTLPDDFHTHRRIKKVYDERRHMVESGEGVDWGMAEALAFGTLLAEGQQFCSLQPSGIRCNHFICQQRINACTR